MGMSRPWRDVRGRGERWDAAQPQLVAVGDGLLAPVRTYESTGMRAATGVGFLGIGRVTLLVREVREMVRQPAMVPAH